VVYLFWLVQVFGLDVEAASRLSLVTLSERLEHVQGIDVDGTHLWVSSVDRATKKGWLRRFELRTGRLLNKVAVEEGERYHPGGIVLDGGSIWVPVAEYKASSSTTVQRRDKVTLALQSSFAVADHIGCLATFGQQLVGGNWDSRVLYHWRKDGGEVRRVENQSGVAFQDLKPWSGGLLIGGGIREKRRGEVAVFHPLTGVASEAWPAGKTDRGVHLTNEGLAVRRGRLYLLPEDGDSRLFVFAFPPKPEKPVKRR
jgi:hypothetical protein